jgi:hypothetical protein
MRREGGRLGSRRRGDGALAGGGEGIEAEGAAPAGLGAGRRRPSLPFLFYIYFLIGLISGVLSISAILSYFCQLSTNKWVLPDSFGVNFLLTGCLLELQKNCRIAVDFGYRNVKWYHLVHLSTKVVVLCYSLGETHKDTATQDMEPLPIKARH